MSLLGVYLVLVLAMPGKLNVRATLLDMKRMYASMHRVHVQEVLVRMEGTTLSFSLQRTEVDEQEGVTAELVQAVSLRSELHLTKKGARDALPRAVPYHLVEQARRYLHTCIPVHECKVCACKPVQTVEGAYVTLQSRLQEVLDAPWSGELLRGASGTLLVRLGVDGTSKWHQGIEVCPDAYAAAGLHHFSFLGTQPVCVPPGWILSGA